MKPLFRNILLNKYTLLVLFILFFGFSLVFNKLYSNRSLVTRETRLADTYIKDQEKDFHSFLRDTGLIRKLISNKESLHEFTRIAQKKYGIFIFSVSTFGNTEMKFWSDQAILPPADTYQSADGEYFRKLSNGKYFIIKRTISSGGMAGKQVCFAMIPVFHKFFIETDYLPESFVFSNTAEKRVQIVDHPTAFPVATGSGKVLFYLDKKTNAAVPYNDTMTIILRIGSLIFLFLFIHGLAETTARRKGYWKGIGLLAGILLGLRLLTYYYPSLLNLRQFELFNPAIYGSNVVQRSLGDLLINAILFCWIILFSWSKLRQVEDPAKKFTDWLRWTVGILSLCLLIYSTFILASVIRSLIADSKISFDVTDFFSLNRFTVAGFVVLACLSLAYYYFSQLLFKLIFPLFKGRSILIYFAIGGAGLIYLTGRSGHPEVLFYLPVLIWLLIYTWLVNRRGVIVNRFRINIAGILFWIFVFSISLAAILLVENNKVEWEKRKRMAEKLSEQTDPSNEYLMSIAIQYLDNDFLSSNFSRFNDPGTGKNFRDSIITENYSGYLNKYDTRLYVFDAKDNGVSNDDPTTYESLNIILTVSSKRTNVPDLFYYETGFDKFNYITRRFVTDSLGKKQGSFFIVSNPKQYSSDALFPELFKQFKENDPENSPLYSNAIYINNQLFSQPGKYPFPIWLTPEEIPGEEVMKKKNGDFDELWYRAGTGKVVVIARKRDTMIEAITLFSYIFCAFLFLVALVQFLSILLRTVYQWKGFRKIFQLNIRTQVHSTIIFISVFSFLIIGAATISFFISRYNRNNSDKLSRTMKIMVNEMQKKISDHSTFDDVVKLYDTVANYDLQKLVEEVSDIHGVDVNVYGLTGDLYVTSEANVYNKGVLSKKIDPTAYYHLSRMRQVQHAQEEKIGRLSYLSIYAPVRDEKGVVYEYINIPYFTSQQELNQEISNFLVTIINLNAFIFLLAGLIALLITNRITSSFSIISDKMKEVNLGRMNEAIDWNRDDEIGELVKEYNKMVAKLGESATALAKSEREGAWREMARQVAHEIKNPLTPMKLNLQYLQKAIRNNQPNVQELTSNVASTLVEQIDHLSKIAADFSQFANIGNTHVELFDLHEVISSLKDLYRPNDKVELNWQPVEQAAIVNADKTQMNRLFTNLIANAVEACHGNPGCRVNITEKIIEDKFVISIQDNGEGIAPEMQSHIFVPNFTTKSSGTGLGLAMCMSIVDQAKGRIWFETEQHKGTTFYVELPLAD